MLNHLVRRLTHGAALSIEDCDFLSYLVRQTRVVGPYQRLVEEGHEIRHVIVMLDGWACCSKVINGDKRLITDLILPGDISHSPTSLLEHTDYSVITLTRSMVAEIHLAGIEKAFERSPSLRRAFRWASRQTDSILRQALINNGRRLAAPRIAHVICEVRARLQSVGIPVENGFRWPLTQDELADLTGMTPVHVNRSIRTLRENGLIQLKHRLMHVPDANRLATFCGFRLGYLHLGHVFA